MPVPHLLRIADAAEFLAVSRSTIYALCAAGELQRVTIGRASRIEVDSLLDYISRHRVPHVGGDGDGRNA